MGAAQDSDKDEFLTELGRVFSDQSVPLLVGGDFNLLRSSAEKNKPIQNKRWMDMFNAVIGTYEMREIHMTGGAYTWSNNQANPTLEKLDHFLMSRDWELLFPMVTVHKLSRDVSDHCPIILDTLENSVKKAEFLDLTKAG